jgi:ElaB/YqjD/DUF883 family membrane-anchored ribosome-binding protein
MQNQNGLRAETLNDRIHLLVSNLKTAASSFKDRATEAKSHAATIAAKTGRAIKAHPLVAIGVALGAGYLTGRLLRPVTTDAQRLGR